MEQTYQVLNYNKTIPANITRTVISSDTQKSELQWHREAEIAFVLSGKCECSVNGDVNIINANDFVIFNSEDVHLIRPVSGTKCDLLCIELSFEYMRLFCKPIESVVFDVSDKPRIKEELIKLLHSIADVKSTDEYSALLRVAYVNQLYYTLLSECIHFRRNNPNLDSNRRDLSYAKTAIAYINENFKREIPLEEISGVVNLSPSYFSKYFKQVTRMSFSEYLANLRLESAMNDMLTKNSSVQQASEENGFANVKSFITHCKKVYNLTPAQYKRRVVLGAKDI